MTKYILACSSLERMQDINPYPLKQLTVLFVRYRRKKILMLDPNQLFIAYKEYESVSFINTQLKFPNKSGTRYRGKTLGDMNMMVYHQEENGKIKNKSHSLSRVIFQPYLMSVSPPNAEIGKVVLVPDSRELPGIDRHHSELTGKDSG